MYTYKYARPALTTDALVYMREGEEVSILLIRRGRPPFQGSWALPGGFVDYDELLEASCRRELAEETGLEVPSMQQFRVFDAPDRDPRHRTISVVYSAELPARKAVTGGDDAAEARWFPLSDLPAMAFDHREIVDSFFSDLILE